MKNNYEINDKNLSLNNVLELFASYINEKIDRLYFTYNGKILSLNNSKNIKLNDDNKKIFVFNSNMNKYKKSQQFKNILCPKCRNFTILNIKENTFEMECINKPKHEYKDLTINSFIESQNIDESKFICCKCGNNKLYYNEFYVTSNRLYICPLCYKKNNNLIKIDFYDKYYICLKHNKNYISYCYNCKMNLCDECENEVDHVNHKIVLYKAIKPGKKRIEELENDKIKINNYKRELLILNKYFKEFSDINLDIIQDLNNYIKIYENVINSYGDSNSSVHYCNYESIVNISNFKAKKLIKQITSFLEENKITTKFNHIVNLYETYNKINQLTMVYKKGNKIHLFGSDFVKKNKPNCYLLINYKKYDLCEFYYNFKKNDTSETLIVKLIGNKKITDMSGIFHYCDSLVSIDFSKWDTKFVNNMSNMFSDCYSLSSINGLSNLNISNVTDISGMFCRCKLISRLPDISNWATNNITNMSNLFSGCASLKYIPDISKWNTDNVKDMRQMFYCCQSLVELPAIHKWNTYNVTDMSEMFCNCSKLLLMPNISEWNTQNVINMNNMFLLCTSLKNLKGISKLNTKKS